MEEMTKPDYSIDNFVLTTMYNYRYNKASKKAIANDSKRNI